MRLKDIVEQLHLTVVAGKEGLEKEVSDGYTSDLLSDVMGNAESGMIWITLQTHKNVMAIASLKDLAAVLLVKGLQPEPAMAEQAEEEGIAILSTELSAFEISGKLYQILH
ncbi:MAG: serine kinase [Sphingobacteriia bacterium]|nr:serine kinase [Sphingobacteriia bacterium]